MGEQETVAGVKRGRERDGREKRSFPGINKATQICAIILNANEVAAAEDWCVREKLRA